MPARSSHRRQRNPAPPATRFAAGQVRICRILEPGSDHKLPRPGIMWEKRRDGGGWLVLGLTVHDRFRDGRPRLRLFDWVSENRLPSYLFSPVAVPLSFDDIGELCGVLSRFDAENVDRWVAGNDELRASVRPGRFAAEAARHRTAEPS